MKFTVNEGYIDRVIRFVLAEIFLLLGLFWFGGVAQIAFLIGGVLLLGTAIMGYCGLYSLLRVHTCPIERKPLNMIQRFVIFTFLFVVAIAGSYASIFMSTKIFLEDYNQMNQFYKQALFFTGQEKREEVIVNYTKLVSEFQGFKEKYQRYHPYVIMRDGAFNTDLDTVTSIIKDQKELVASGDLKTAHLRLEGVRPVFQDMLKRNGFSMLAVALVDFHDAMEKIITASDAKDTAGVIAVYGEVSEKLSAVEEIANDAEIQAIRMNLEQLLVLAKENNTDALSVKAAELKSSFVKVYLVRG